MKIKVEDLLDLCDLANEGLEERLDWYIKSKQYISKQDAEKYLGVLKYQNNIVWKVCSTNLVGEKEMDDIDQQKRLEILSRLQFVKQAIDVEK